MDKKIKIIVAGKEVDINTFLQMVKQGRSPMSARLGIDDNCISDLVRQGAGNAGVKFGGRFDVECIGAEGKQKWKDYIDNIVVNVGLQHILDILYVSATAQIDPWYVGLTDSAPTVAAADTMASHAGWVEENGYTGNRQAFIDVRSGQSVGNSASKASFPITGTATIGGAFMNSAATGTAGSLLCGGAFSGGDRPVVNGDTLNVTYTFTAADDGV